MEHSPRGRDEARCGERRVASEHWWGLKQPHPRIGGVYAGHAGGRNGRRRRPLGIRHPLYDALAWHQQIALLEYVATALLTEIETYPELNAINEAAVGAIYENIRQCLDFELSDPDTVSVPHGKFAPTDRCTRPEIRIVTAFPPPAPTPANRVLSTRCSLPRLEDR